MKASHSHCQTTRHPARDFVLCVWLCILAVQSPVLVLGQADYSTPYTFTTLAGLAGSRGSADGTGSAARFYGPGGVAVDSAGNVYADSQNNTIRKVTAAGVGYSLALRRHENLFLCGTPCRICAPARIKRLAVHC